MWILDVITVRIAGHNDVVPFSLVHDPVMIEVHVTERLIQEDAQVVVVGQANLLPRRHRRRRRHCQTEEGQHSADALRGGLRWDSLPYMYVT